MSEEAKTLEERNAEFLALPKAECRVAIARDVLEQIAAGNYEIARGNWVRTSAKRLDQAKLLESQPPICTCCAIGAAMLSSIRLADERTISYGFASTGETFDQVEKFFAEDQQRLIEIAFEGGGGKFRALGEREGDAINYGVRFTDHKQRAIAIFQNIIDNRGEFKP